MRDNSLILSDEQAVTATADSTNHIDLGAGKDHKGNALIPGAGRTGKMFLNITVDVTTTSGGATTADFALQDSADDTSFAATPIIISAVAKATLVAGYRVMRMPLPPNLRRYVKVVYTVNVADFTAGKFSASLDWGAEQLT